MATLSAKYGPVVGIFFGSQPAVIINGYTAVREALHNEDLNGRPDSVLLSERTWGKRLGVMFVEGSFWQTQRRFALHQFRNLGFGKRSHESVILEDLQDLVQEMLSYKGPFCPMGQVGVSSLNILWAVLGGVRLDRSDPELHDLVDRIDALFRAGGTNGGLVSVFPFLRHIAPEASGFNPVVRGYVGIRTFIERAVQEHKATNDEDNPRDFIDIYLKQMKHNADSSFSEEQLVALCMDVLAAGSETGSSLVGFAILFMSLHPEVQAKVQEELDLVVGREKMPTIEDRPNLPYTDAALTEVFRLRCPAPTTVPHMALRPTKLQGYHLPAGTMCIVNTYSVLMDPDYWVEPEVFRPERFLSPEGKFRKDERFFPFGKGKRICLGEALARMSTFLMFAGLLHQLRFSFPPEEIPDDTEGTSGFALAPHPFRVLVEARS
ncbi:methyl farnesoate epoxidase-like isoform X2 [Oratosquilla oratoria]